MNMSPLASTSSNPVIGALNQCLADIYGIYALAQNAHWNVEGPNFGPLHAEFGGQYEDAGGATDLIAERIRQLDAYVSVSLTSFDQRAGLLQPQAPQPEKAWIAALMAAHRKAVAGLKTLEKASATSDLETQNLAIDRVSVHQMTIWRLRSLLK